MTSQKDKPNLSDWQKAYEDICGIAIIGSILSGTLGFIAGTIIATQNCKSEKNSIKDKMSISYFNEYLQSCSFNVNSSKTGLTNPDIFSF